MFRPRPVGQRALAMCPIFERLCRASFDLHGYPQQRSSSCRTSNAPPSAVSPARLAAAGFDPDMRSLAESASVSVYDPETVGACFAQESLGSGQRDRLSLEVTQGSGTVAREEG